MMLGMDHILVVLLASIWSSGVLAEEIHNHNESVRLVGGLSRCSGALEVNRGDWRPVFDSDWALKEAAVACRELGCGSAVSIRWRVETSHRSVWEISSNCVHSASALRDCAKPDFSPFSLVLTCSDSVRLVNGTSLCSGRLEVKSNQSNQSWSSVCEDDFDQQDAEVVCRELGCGPPSVLQGALYGEVEAPMWTKEFQCGGNESALLDCRRSGSERNTCSPGKAVGLTCSEPVRFVEGSTRCSGTLELKQGEWRPVKDWNYHWTLKEAAAACRQLDCGSNVSIERGEESSNRPVWGIRHDCVQSASAPRDCVTPFFSSQIPEFTCSSATEEEIHNETEPVRLVGGPSRCAGTLELNHDGEWRPVYGSIWTTKAAAVICRELDCGSAASVGEISASSERYDVWRISSDCVQSGSALRKCVIPGDSIMSLEITCSDSVRLVNGTGLCSGRLEVKSNHSNQWWSSVCEDDFDLQDAKVVCRELGCGAPSVLQGALYGEVEAPMWTKEFQCEGHESALLDCRRSGSERNTCSPGKAVGLTCSEPVRLVEELSHCSGALEVNHEADWRPVFDSDWALKEAAVACRELGCGSAVSVQWREETSERSVWRIRPECVHSTSTLRDCVKPDSSSFSLVLTCSDSVRLVNGTGLCSGRLEVKSNQSNQWWSPVCEADFDQQDAEVVCREIGCGAPSLLQGALYGEGEAPMWTKEFQCGGHESALLDCRRSGSERNSSSPGTAVGLTCSEPVRLVEGTSNCTGSLELRQGEWRPVNDWNYHWTLKEAAVVCRELDCGCTVSVRWREESSVRPVWGIRPDCVHSTSTLRDCVKPESSPYILEITCSDLLVQPNISVSLTMDEVSEVQQQTFHVIGGSSFIIRCSTQPQFPGGSFLLTFISSNSAHNHTQPAVNHSAHFLFPAADDNHQGLYSCVYHVLISTHNFSSVSRLLSLTVSDVLVRRVKTKNRRAPGFPLIFIVLLVLVVLSLMWYIIAVYLSCKATRKERSKKQMDTELVNLAHTERKRRKPEEHT